MVNPKELGPATSPSAYYGSELRRYREKMGISQRELGDLVYCSGGYIGQIEVAARNPQAELSERFDKVFETGDHFARIYLLAAHRQHAAHFTRVAELEAQAEQIFEYAPTLVPGLLQTADYARAVIRASNPFIEAEEVEEKVSARLGRVPVLTDTAAAKLWVVLHEAVLRLPVGGRCVMTEQLRHLLYLVRAGKLVLQVLPFSEGEHSLVTGSLFMMTFAEAPPVAYVEGPYSGQLLDDPVIVARCQAAYDAARAASLSPKASLPLIESAAEEYAHEQRP
ncbi:helix-turn-helix transcriptional regulator [Kitasatospora saccharophila]|uniref:Helix-turn-helix transcriptional regulator n=1 Tax=Kitasatospora saccharophila TaxID=407973 RepID=A0ABN2X915_9ACTN